jgi:hypothetical protein
MRSSLVLAALGISVIACNAEESKSAKSDWQCAPTAVHNGETVTCTASAKGPKDVAANEPQAPGGGEVFVRTYGVPTSDTDAGSAESNTGTGSGDSTTAGGGSAEGESSADAPSVPSTPGTHDCSVGGENCPPVEALPPGPAAATDYRCKTGDQTTTCTRKTIECKAGTMQVGEECLASGEAPTIPSGGGCTLTQGYWKNHPSKWPTQMLTIGGVTYAQAELLTIFATPPTGDASLILGHQLIASMLNAANGAGQAQVGSAIQAAQAWMAANKDADGRLPYGVAATSAGGAAAVAISATLDTYNNGGLGVPHCN